MKCTLVRRIGTVEAIFDPRLKWDLMLDLCAWTNSFVSLCILIGSTDTLDFMSMFQSLLDAHTTYYLPSGYGAVYFTTPFAIKSRMENGAQKFYTGAPPYPFELWVQVCGLDCPYSESMEGWEISQLNGTDVPSYIKSFSRIGGTYYDDGVRANAFLATGWGQTSLSSNLMPPANFTITLINPSTDVPITMTLPFAFGGELGFNQSSLRAANAALTSSKRAHELFAERLLLDALSQESAHLRRRSDPDSQGRASEVDSAILELSLNLERIRVDSQLAHAVLRRDGAKALLTEDKLPFIPSPRQRMDDVFRLEKALFPRKTESSAQFDAESKEVENLIERNNEARKEYRNAKENSTIEIPVITGTASSFTTYTTYPSSPTNAYEGLSAFYGSYKKTSVVRLRSFSASVADTNWVNSLQNAANTRASKGLSNNLILDVTNNGGGSVCLCLHSLSYLVNAWSDLSVITGSDIVYSPYDIRMSPLLDLLYQVGGLTSSGAFNTTTGAFMGTSFYLNPTSRTIGSQTSEYTQPFNWNPCGTSNQFFTKAATYHFDKIIVITDGRCGSACAYFLTQLRENNKARIVSYGGLYGEPLATSSFAGGNVYTWDYIRSVLPSVPANPYTSYIAYNIRENFSAGKYPSTPRQFDRLEADWYLPYWNNLWRFYNVDNYDPSARFTLYESVLPLFDEMPSGLASAASPSASGSSPLYGPSSSVANPFPASPYSSATPLPLGPSIYATLISFSAILISLFC